MIALRNQINLTGASINSDLFDPFASLGNMPAWMGDAPCATVDPELFFPETGGATVSVARSICAECPVRAECLQYALDNDERHGIFGGLTAKERAKVTRGELTTEEVLRPNFHLKQRVCVECGVGFDGHGAALTCSKYCHRERALRRERELRSERRERLEGAA